MGRETSCVCVDRISEMEERKKDINGSGEGIPGRVARTLCPDCAHRAVW